MIIKSTESYLFRWAYLSNANYCNFSLTDQREHQECTPLLSNFFLFGPISGFWTDFLPSRKSWIRHCFYKLSRERKGKYVPIWRTINSHIQILEWSFLNCVHFMNKVLRNLKRLCNYAISLLARWSIDFNKEHFVFFLMLKKKQHVNQLFMLICSESEHSLSLTCILSCEVINKWIKFPSDKGQSNIK